jgi:hypothetical protein
VGAARDHDCTKASRWQGLRGAQRCGTVVRTELLFRNYRLTRHYRLLPAPSATWQGGCKTDGSVSHVTTGKWGGFVQLCKCDAIVLAVVAAVS